MGCVTPDLVASNRNMTETSSGNKGTFLGHITMGWSKLENQDMEFINTPLLTQVLSASLFVLASASQTGSLSKGGPMVPKVAVSHLLCLAIWGKFSQLQLKKIAGDCSDWSGLGHVPIPGTNFHGQGEDGSLLQNPVGLLGLKVSKWRRAISRRREEGWMDRVIHTHNRGLWT